MEETHISLGVFMTVRGTPAWFLQKELKESLAVRVSEEALQRVLAAAEAQLALEVKDQKSQPESPAPAPEEGAGAPEPQPEGDDGGEQVQKAQEVPGKRRRWFGK